MGPHAVTGAAADKAPQEPACLWSGLRRGVCLQYLEEARRASCLVFCVQGSEATVPWALHPGRGGRRASSSGLIVLDPEGGAGNRTSSQGPARRQTACSSKIWPSFGHLKSSLLGRETNFYGFVCVCFYLILSENAP